jgi:hypothetical protein
MSVEASASTDWSVLINKRVRAITKKLNDIATIEKRVAAGEKVLPEQLAKIDQKSTLEASLLELNKLIKSAPAEPVAAAAPSPVAKPQREPSPVRGGGLDAVGHLLHLFFAARFLSTKIPGGKENREALLAERKDVEAYEFDAVQFLTARIDGSANPFSAAHA